LKLIVEAGSTNTDSVLVDKNGAIYPVITSPGINPVTDHGYLSAITALAKQHSNTDIDHIFYYGSGCIDCKVKQRVANDLKSAFTVGVAVDVQDDLIAVGHGLCMDGSGIVGILGTGSNMGYYNGSTITDGVKSCGYIIGDEGSGYRLGEAVYRRLARGLLPPRIMDLIQDQLNLNKDNCITILYEQSNIRQYVASFATILSSTDEGLRSEICREVFTPFIDRMILPMWRSYQVPVFLSGSVAFHFQTELNEMLRKSNNIAASFVASPLAGLIKYHSYDQGD